MADKLVTEYAWQGPKRGVDRAVLLAHGAGSDMNGAALIAVADALADVGVPSLRFNYPYRSSGKKAPDRPKVLDGATREAAAELARRAKLAPERLVLGGRSMGGRYCSLVVGRGRRPRARARTAAPRLSPARRRAGPISHACRALRSAARAGAVRERDARLDGRQEPTSRKSRAGSRGRCRSTGSTPPTTVTGP